MRKSTIAAVAALMVTLVGCGDQAKKSGEQKAEQKIASGDRDAKAGEPDAKSADGAKPGADAAANADPVAMVLATVQAYNAGDFEAAIAAFDPEVKVNFVGAPEPEIGAEHIKTSWEQSRAAIPDAKMSVARLLVSDELVAMHTVMTGTHKGELMGTAPTDKPIGTESFFVMTLDDNNKIVETTIFTNPMAAATQVGAAPEGVPPVPVAQAPSGEPEIIKGEANEANVRLVQSFYAAIQDGSVAEKAGEFLAEDSKHHNVALGQDEQGLESAKKSMGEMMAAISDISISDAKFHSVGDHVLVIGKWSGKHTGDLGPLKATNKEFSTDYADLFRIEDGKIVEAWTYENPVQMLTQLGVVPESPAPNKDAVAAK